MFFSGWAIGLLLFAFFSGFKPSSQDLVRFEEASQRAGPVAAQRGNLEETLWMTQQRYYASKGWFSCDATCTRNKKDLDDVQQRYDLLLAEEQAHWSDAKAGMSAAPCGLIVVG